MRLGLGCAIEQQGYGKGGEKLKAFMPYHLAIGKPIFCKVIEEVGGISVCLYSLFEPEIVGRIFISGQNLGCCYHVKYKKGRNAGHPQTACTKVCTKQKLTLTHQSINHVVTG